MAKTVSSTPEPSFPPRNTISYEFTGEHIKSIPQEGAPKSMCDGPELNTIDISE